MNTITNDIFNLGVAMTRAAAESVRTVPMPASHAAVPGNLQEQEFEKAMREDGVLPAEDERDA